MSIYIHNSIIKQFNYTWYRMGNTLGSNLLTDKHLRYRTVEKTKYGSRNAGDFVLTSGKPFPLLLADVVAITVLFLPPLAHAGMEIHPRDSFASFALSLASLLLFFGQ